MTLSFCIEIRNAGDPKEPRCHPNGVFIYHAYFDVLMQDPTRYRMRALHLAE